MTAKRERDVPRHPRRFRVELNGWHGETQDVSLGGFSAELIHPPKVGSDVLGTIEMGRNRYSFSGRVIWVHSGEHSSRIGIRFSGVENLYLQSFTRDAAHPL